MSTLRGSDRSGQNAERMLDIERGPSVVFGWVDLLSIESEPSADLGGSSCLVAARCKLQTSKYRTCKHTLARDLEDPDRDFEYIEGSVMDHLAKRFCSEIMHTDLATRSFKRSRRRDPVIIVILPRALEQELQKMVQVIL